ncbi:hypothetical protein GGI07_004984 [Coemansia sp. Benny D115]|nr:hypothetical protein GGI07_004984 [Coemansia sp. Benny D115]
MTVSTDINVDELSNMKRKQLQALCKKHGIRANAKSEELVEQLVDYFKNGSKPVDSDKGTNIAETQDDDTDNNDQEEEEEEEECENDAMQTEAMDNSTLRTETSVREEDVSEVKPAQAKVDVEAEVEAVDKAVEDTASQPASPAQESSSQDTLMAAEATATQGTDSEAASEPAAEAILEPAVETVSDNTEKKSVSERIAAELEARVADLTAEQRKKLMDEYTAEHGAAIPSTPAGPKRQLVAPKSASFNRAHDKMFSKDESIATHWSTSKLSAATPKSKRPANEPSVPASNKRVCVDGAALFSPRAAQKPADFKNEDGQTDAITPVVLFADKLETASEQSQEVSAEPLTTSMAAENESVVVSAEPEAQKETQETQETQIDTSETKSIQNTSDTAKQQPTAPASADTTSKAEPTQTKLTTLATNISGTAAPRPSLIPAPRKSIRPSSVTNAKPEAKTAAVSGGAQPKGTAATASASVSVAGAPKAPSTQRPVKDHRNVESKIKSYIHAKPPSPKIKAVKHTIVDPKQARPVAPAKTAPAPSVAKKVKAPDSGSKNADGKDVPNYMKATKATEIRANKPATAVPKSNLENKGGAPKTRFHPYSRSARPAK